MIRYGLMLLAVLVAFAGYILTANEDAWIWASVSFAIWLLVHYLDFKEHHG